MELTVLSIFMHISLINTELVLFLWNDHALSRVHLRSGMQKTGQFTVLQDVMHKQRLF